MTETTPDRSFPTETAGVRGAKRPETIRLEDGARLNLEIVPVRKRLGDAEVRMLAYNGSIPGPTIVVDDGSGIEVVATNRGDVETTVHWHGLRLDNLADGVPGETQDPIGLGETLTITSDTGWGESRKVCA